MYPGQLPPPPPKRRRPLLWVSLGLVAVLLFCGVPTALVASRLPDLAGDGARAAGPSAGPPPSPGPNSPARVRHAWITYQIGDILDRQTKALLAGDQKAFLGVVDPMASKLVVSLKRRFASLRAMRVIQYTQHVAGIPIEGSTAAGKPTWKTRIDIDYCFSVRGCDTDTITVDTAWVETADGLRMTSMSTSGAESNGPRPWEVTELKAAVGKRVVVATTGRYASRLSGLLAQAEKAAAVADRYVIGDRPDQYRIFIAGASEWKRWYGGELPPWSVGFATPVSDDRMEVVLNVTEIETSYLDEVLRHELGHVATLSTDAHADDSDFWLIEGMAEYIQESGRKVGSYDGRYSVRRFLDTGTWDGDVAVTEPTGNSEDWEVAAAYGIGYYAVRRMAERFGREKLTRFFTLLVLERGKTLDVASRSSFGVPWKSVNADCAKYVRSQT